MPKTKQVIIGNSAAALSAIRTIRKKNCSDRITLISAENYNAYSPVLTAYYIAHKIKRGDLFIADSQFYRDHEVRVKFGNKAVGIDTRKQVVYLENSGTVEYDSLLIATGASPQMIDKVETDALDYVSVLRTIEDADKMIKLSNEAKEIVILGAGLVSLQIADAVFRDGVKITFVVGSKQVLSQNLDAELAAIVQRKLESQGISFLFNQQVQAIMRENGQARVVMGSGEGLRADLVAVGKGLNPNIGPVAGSDIKVNRGILVDECMRTSIENIFAAGDVAEGKNSISGKNEIIANWLNACAQGEVAGFNMAGYSASRECQFRENITTVMGLSIASVGLSSVADGDFEELRYTDPQGRVFRKILLNNNRIIGAVLLGNTDDIGVFRYCIENKVDISSWRDQFPSSHLDFAEIIRQRLAMTAPEPAKMKTAWPTSDLSAGSNPCNIDYSFV